jgi:hypothetical protein
MDGLNGSGLGLGEMSASVKDTTEAVSGGIATIINAIKGKTPTPSPTKGDTSTTRPDSGSQIPTWGWAVLAAGAIGVGYMVWKKRKKA